MLAAVDLVSAIVLVMLVLLLGLLVGLAWVLARGRSQARSELARMSRVDPLTGIANRTFWDEELPRELARAERSGQGLCMALIDIDHFAQFTERFGGTAGDALLTDAAQTWRGLLPEIDLLARLEDAFGVVVAGANTASTVEMVAALRARTPQGQRISAGVATWDGVEPASAFEQRAGAALAEARRRLGNCTMVAGDSRDAPGAAAEVARPGPLAATADLQPATAGRCADASCARTDAVRCEYIDRRRNRCELYYCSDHTSNINGQLYCRRHAGVIQALGANVTQEPLPALDNRAPALANWVSRDLDHDVRALLSEYRNPGDEVKSGAVHSVLTHDRQRSWRRDWDLFSHTGVLLSVGISVDESRDAVVLVTVDGKLVTEVVPPWIGRRAEHGDDDVERRLAFYRDIIEGVRPVVAAQAQRSSAGR